MTIEKAYALALTATAENSFLIRMGCFDLGLQPMTVERPDGSTDEAQVDLTAALFVAVAEVSGLLGVCESFDDLQAAAMKGCEMAQTDLSLAPRITVRANELERERRAKPWEWN